MFKNIIRKNINEDDFIYFSILALPTSFLVGPAVIEVFIFSICFFFIKTSIKKKNFYFLKNKIFIIFIVFLFLATFSSLMNAENKLMSVLKSIAYIRFIIFFYAIKNFLENNKEKIKSIYISIILPLCFAGITGWLDFFDVHEFFFKNYQYNSRVSGIFKDELILGSYIFAFFFLIISIHSICKTKLKFDYIIFLFLFSVIILSNERMVLIKLISFLFILLIFFICLKNFKKGLVFLTAVSFLTYFIFSYNPARLYGFYKFKNYVERVYTEEILKEKYIDDKQFSVASYDYLDLFKTGIYSAKLHFPFGVGIRNFRNICDNEGIKHLSFKKCSTHPHNLFIEILSETGFLGFVSFILFLLVFIFLILKNQTISLFNKLLLFLSFLSFFWPISTTGSFFNNYYSSLIWYNLSIIHFLSSLKKVK